MNYKKISEPVEVDVLSGFEPVNYQNLCEAGTVHIGDLSMSSAAHVDDLSMSGAAQIYNMSNLLKRNLHAVCVDIEKHVGLQVLRQWIDEILNSFCIEDTNSFMEQSSPEDEDIKYEQENLKNNLRIYRAFNDNHVIVYHDTDAQDSVYTDEIVLQYGDDIVTQDVHTTDAEVNDDREVDSLLTESHHLQSVDVFDSHLISIVDDANIPESKVMGFVVSNINTILGNAPSVKRTQDSISFSASAVAVNNDTEVQESFKFLDCNRTKKVKNNYERVDDTHCYKVETVNNCVFEAATTTVETIYDCFFKAVVDGETGIPCGGQNVCSGSSSISCASDIRRKSFQQCNICLKTCSNKSNLVTHMRTHSKDRPFVCKECGKDFRILHNLHLHQRTHTGERDHVCAKCGKAFAWPESLKRHQSTHSSERPYSCAHCEKKFSHNQHLVRHLRVAHVKYECRFICTRCGKNCSSSYDLKVHEPWCRGERPHVCSYCDKTFAAARNLKQHERVHTGERPYACTICDKSFQLSSYVKVHIRQVHSDERPYKCTNCDMSFAVKRVLTRHMLVHSTREKPFSCMYCDKKLSSAFALKAHVEKHMISSSSVVGNVAQPKKIRLLSKLVSLDDKPN